MIELLVIIAAVTVGVLAIFWDHNKDPYGQDIPHLRDPRYLAALERAVERAKTL